MIESPAYLKEKPILQEEKYKNKRSSFFFKVNIFSSSGAQSLNGGKSYPNLSIKFVNFLSLQILRVVTL